MATSPGISLGTERLVFFTDAVVAIAATLLILPLVDRVPEAARESADLADFFAVNGAQVAAFFLSFVVIARLWLAHHALFEHVAASNRTLRWLNLLWALTIVMLPLPTGFVAEYAPSSLSVALYVGTMFLSSLTLTALTIVVRRTPGLERQDNPLGPDRGALSFVTPALFAVALIVGAAIPVINYWALLVLLLSGVVNAIVSRGIHRLK